MILRTNHRKIKLFSAKAKKGHHIQASFFSNLINNIIMAGYHQAHSMFSSAINASVSEDPNRLFVQLKQIR